jgi:hypothetical protein
MQKPPIAFALITAIAGGWQPAVADTALSARLSTLGYGVELTRALSPKSNLRFGLNNATFDRSATESGINYSMDLRLSSGSLLYDWHPFSGGFHTSLGVLYNANKLDAQAITTEPVTIGDTTYPAGTNLTGRIDFNRGAPYLGVGWGNAVGARKKTSFTFELGVVFQGSPNVKLNASAGVSQSDLDKEERELRDELAEFKHYPVVTFGFGYKF